MALRYSATELMNLRSSFPLSCLDVLKSFHIMRRPRYVHRASRHKFVQMNTTVTVPTVNCRTSWSRRHQNNRHAELVNLRPLAHDDVSVPPNSSSKTTADFMLLNTRSLNNKAELIHDIIAERKLHFMCLTETWQNQQDFLALNLATPPGYVYIQKPRSSGRGGGLAVIHNSNIVIKVLPTTASTFECIHFALTGAAQLQVVLVYRPPKSTNGFLSELSELLTAICPMSPSTIIMGDFNIHVDSHNSPLATEFLSLLDCLNITQHVHGPTHVKGHTLDLVCSTGITPLHLQCLDLAVSDHHAILFSVPEPPSRLRVKRTITFRNIKRVSTPALSSTLSLHLAAHPSGHSVDALTEHYNKALSLSLDAVAPLKTRSISYTQPAPWFTPELRLMKAAGRRLERLWKKSGLIVHQEAYKDHVRSYKEALSRAKTSYYSILINNQQNHPKQLFSTVNHLLRPPDPPQPSDATELCSKFQTFFQQKVEDIHRQLHQSGAPCPSATNLKDCDSTSAAHAQHCSLSSFSPLSNNQVMDLVSKAKASSSKLDPLPTALVKACLPTLCPTMTAIINTSLTSGVVPTSFKTAMVIPILKKPSLDPDDPGSYRPISNLPFLSKILEKAVAAQLQLHMSHHELFEPLQSGFRPHHSTETALIKITNDLLTAADNGHISLLILLDLSAAFDTVSHTILLHRLHDRLGLTGSALSWFHSYLSDRTQYITIKDSNSTPAPVNHGVPQGSVLGPLLFTIYMLPLGQIIRQHGLSFHCYADDTQLYISTKPTAHLPPLSLVHCLDDIKTWMATNFLKLNNNKTELMVVSPPSLSKEVGDILLNVDGCTIRPSKEVRNLGVTLDCTLSLQAHINNTTKSAFFHLKNICRLRPSLSLTVAETLIHVFITSRLDYCNGVLYGLPSKALDRLQRVQNSAARALTHTKRWQHITPTLKQLHWLPVKSRISYKILLLTYKSLHNLAPQYLSDLLQPYSQSRSLRSSGKNQLVIPRSKLRTFGDRAFCIAAPTLWNSLPLHIRQAPTLATFKKHLKSHLFTEAYGP